VGSNFGTVLRRHAAFSSSLSESEMTLPELLLAAEHVRELAEHPGWVLVLDLLDGHARREMDRLLSMTTKPEEVTRLRGVLAGLRSPREAAETVLAVAADREREAKKRLEEAAV
jgi:hypothetical protein